MWWRAVEEWEEKEAERCKLRLYSLIQNYSQGKSMF